MRKLNCKTLAAIVAFVVLASCADAQKSEAPAYLNNALPPEQCTADLVHRMTVEEKATPLANRSRALRGFKRVHLKSGELQESSFELKDRDLGIITEAGESIIAKGQYSLAIGNGQPATGAPTVMEAFEVKATKTLPE